MKLSVLFVSLALFFTTVFSAGILSPKPGVSVAAGGSFSFSFEHSIVVAIYYFGNVDVSLVPIAASTNATAIPLASYAPSIQYPQVISLPRSAKPGAYLLLAVEHIYPLNSPLDTTAKDLGIRFNQTFFVV